MVSVAVCLCLLLLPFNEVSQPSHENNRAAMLTLKWYEKFIEDQLNDKIDIGAPPINVMMRPDYLADNRMQINLLPAKEEADEAATTKSFVEAPTGYEYAARPEPVAMSEPTEAELKAKYSSKVFYAETYHIIIASLATEEAALKFLKEVKGYSFKDLYIVKKDGRYRVAVKMFWDKAEADSYLNAFRAKNKAFATAWIFVDLIKG
jgi:hypothetical protein